MCIRTYFTCISRDVKRSKVGTWSWKLILWFASRLVPIAPAPATAPSGDLQNGSDADLTTMCFNCQARVRKKVKCDRTVPTCSSCSKARLQCVYQAPPPRKRKRSQFEDMHERLARYERILQDNHLLPTASASTPCGKETEASALSTRNPTPVPATQTVRSGKLLSPMASLAILTMFSSLMPEKAICVNYPIPTKMTTITTTPQLMRAPRLVSLASSRHIQSLGQYLEAPRASPRNTPAMKRLRSSGMRTCKTSSLFARFFMFRLSQEWLTRAQNNPLRPRRATNACFLSSTFSPCSPCRAPTVCKSSTSRGTV